MEWICFNSYLFLLVYVCLFEFFTFSSWQALEMKFKEVATCWNLLGSDEPGDHI